MAGERITEADVIEALRNRYAPPAYALLSHVPTATGARHTATIDAIAIGLWPSRGLTVHGFEIKVSRTDWLRELANPQKAEWGAKHCDYWSMVTTKGLVRPGELPATWGLLEWSGKQFKCVKEAPELPSGKRDSKTAMPISREFVAAIARKVDRNSLTHDQVEQKIREAREAAVRDATTYERHQRESLERQLADYKHRIETFEKSAGIRIHEHYVGDIEAAGKLFAIIRRGVADTDYMLRQMKHERETLTRAATKVTDAINAVLEYDQLRRGVSVSDDSQQAERGVVDQEESPDLASRPT